MIEIKNVFQLFLYVNNCVQNELKRAQKKPKHAVTVCNLIVQLG